MDNKLLPNFIIVSFDNKEELDTLISLFKSHNFMIDCNLDYERIISISKDYEDEDGNIHHQVRMSNMTPSYAACYARNNKSIKASYLISNFENIYIK